MKFLRIGHYTDKQHATGISVFLFEQPAIAAYWLSGSAPATHELTALDLGASVTHIDSLMFTGGSAFGLSAVAGVMQWLKQQKRGVPTPAIPVPIVPTVAIYDLANVSHESPTAEHAYQACVIAKENEYLQGRVGAGTGATVGKIVPNASLMPGGIGCAQMMLADGIEILVYAVVNAVGDVRNASGDIIAGARLADGSFIDSEQYLMDGHEEKSLHSSNTTLVAIFTNANFTKPVLQRIAKMAQAGMARAIAPIFTQKDGDIVFAVSLGAKQASEMMIGTIAAELTQQAIVNAVN